MKNMIKIQHHSPSDNIETEEELIDIFLELKKSYEEISSQFKIKTYDGKKVENFKQFIDFTVNKPHHDFILYGSGKIAGIKVKNANIIYELSEIHNLTEYWDMHIKNSCHNCHNRYQEPVLMQFENRCDVVKPMNWSGNCPKYDPHIKNSKGYSAKTLAEIIDDIVK